MQLCLPFPFSPSRAHCTLPNPAELFPLSPKSLPSIRQLLIAVFFLLQLHCWLLQP